MKLFTALYDYTLRCSRHRHAPYYLGGVSFIEAVFFPIPPDVMLAPMALAKPEAAWRFAAITTLTSALGALLGYVLGMFFMHLITPVLIDLGYMGTYEQVQQWFVEWGIWIIFLAGFSPIPFKLFTIAAGAMNMALLPFIIAVLIGRGARFYLVSGLMRWGGAPMEKFLRRIVEWVGWGVVLLVIFGAGISMVACTVDEPASAPIVDGWQQQTATSAYRVQEGDTVYSVAWMFGMDYSDIVRYNKLSEPYTLKSGQALWLTPPRGAHQAVSPERVAHAEPSGAVTYAAAMPAAPEPEKTQAPASPEPTSKPATVREKPITKTEVKTEATLAEKPVLATKSGWLWPAEGKVVKGFSTAAGGNRGIDIGGELRAPVTASASGKVVYTGSSMPGYGRLIILKHDNHDLSAYAFNDSILVKEGEVVKAGQKIATMGKNNEGKPALHFEIRKNGKPQDPMKYLK